MTKDELLGMISRYEGKARHAEMKWQETGDRKYYREWINNDELTDAMRMAHNASDDHEYVKLLEGRIYEWASCARQGDDISKSVEQFAVRHGIIAEQTDWSKVE